ncbi:ABC transporter permease [Paenibacillus sp. GCM10027626]|uniref:ABC transporter permease n=1 Tax=Paenibacillus sp. GCM10027626 TaxID=3273411 RepID=UPI00362801C0
MAQFTKHFWRDKYLLLLLAPVILYLLIFKYTPMFGIVIAFKKYNLFKGIWDSPWVGWNNFTLFFNNHDAYQVIRNTFLLGFYRLLFGFPVPILLALLLNEIRKAMFKRFVQTVSYLPHFISTVVIASMLTMFLSPSGGILNNMLQWLGIQPINFLAEAGWFRTIYVSSDIWQTAGWGSIIYLAALSAIDPQLYEVADIDGATRWQKTMHVTLPGIAPAIIILLILNVGQIVEIGFEKVFLLYNPATYETADIISTYVYRMGIASGNYSYGTAVDLFMGVISFIFVYSANYFSRKYGETSLW